MQEHGWIFSGHQWVVIAYPQPRLESMNSEFLAVYLPKLKCKAEILVLLHYPISMFIMFQFELRASGNTSHPANSELSIACVALSWST